MVSWRNIQRTRRAQILHRHVIIKCYLNNIKNRKNRHKESAMDPSRPKIYERNPDTGVIRWRYIGEKMSDYTWPTYGNALNILS
jgi:hypothetical protein